MKHSLIISFFIVLISLLSACGSQPAQMVYQVPKSTASQQCFITQTDSQIWLEQEDEWNALPIAARQQLESAQVDFTQESILIISAGQKSSSGYRLELTNWLLEQDHWQVTRIAHQPPADSMQAQVITSPCLLVKIPKTIKSFTLNNEQGQMLGRWPY
ncbi:MAG: protease complex subunit PrcB family protein [Oleispira sp.]|nr:protease complex subunit PrcB family protein [Oleispira sp.]MBL4881869.1 protease complex subunit PrcB family protein [Oleispira sp.]